MDLQLQLEDKVVYSTGGSKGIEKGVSISLAKRELSPLLFSEMRKMLKNQNE
jgi:hypothetical protein